MNNGIRIGIFASLMLVLLLPAVANAQSISSALSVYNLQTNPNPIVAGSNVTLTLQLYNSYTSALNNVNLQIQGSYPIVNFSPSQSYIISSVGGGLYGGSQTYFTYHFNIPKNTPSGTYTINLLANYETDLVQSSGVDDQITGESVMPITFYVNGAPNITVTSQAGAITPGGVSSIALGLSNSGYGNARNITLTLINTPNFTAVGSKSFNIGLLGISSVSQVTAQYQASQTLAAGSYAIPVSVSYQSDTGKKFIQNESEEVSVVVNNPNVVVNLTETNGQALYGGYNQSVLLSIANIGTGTAKNVTISLLPSKGLSVLSSVKSYFFGTLGAGQTVTEPLLVSANNNTGVNSKLNALVSYQSQNYGQSFSKNQSIGLSVASSSTFSIATGNYTLAPGETATPLNLVVTNTGNIDAQDVQVIFQSNYPITPVTGSAYIANLAPGQSTTVSFNVTVDQNGAAGTYPITLYETWRQPNGAAQQQYSGSNAYYATVSSGGAGIGTIEYVIIAVVVIGVAGFIIRKRFMKKQPAKKK